MSESSPGNRDDSEPAAPSTARNRRNDRGAGKRATKFQGNCDALKEHVFDSSSSTRSGAELFTKTTRAIAEYVAAEFKDAGEFRLALPDLAFTPLVEPIEGTSGVDANGNRIPTRRDEKIWDIEYAQYVKDKHNREKNMSKVFALILGQCGPSVRDRLEADRSWNQVNASSNPIELLTLIRSCIYQRGTSKKNTHAYLEAERALSLFHQNDKMTNHVFLEKYKELIEVYEHLGGEPGTSQTRITDTLLNMSQNRTMYPNLDPYNPTDDEQADAISTAVCSAQ